MAKFRLQRNSFIAGQISPTAMGRTDLPQYPHACRTLKNAIPLPSGGAYRRPGTVYATSLNASTSYAPALIPFVVSEKEAYCLILSKTVGGSGFVKAIKPNWAMGTEAIYTASGALKYNVASYNSNINLGAGFFDEHHDFQYVQSADVLWLVHPMQKPQTITRTTSAFSGPSFAVQDFDAGLSGTALRDAYPYRAQNTSSVTIGTNGTTGSVNVTASAPIFDQKHVGAIFKFNHGGTYGAVKLTAVNSGTDAVGTVIVTLGATTAVSTWWESSWSNYRGWPRAVCFYQNRLIMAGNQSQPDSLWCSETSDYWQFSHQAIVMPENDPTGVQAFEIQMASQRMNEIQWMSPDDNILVGTTGDEYIVSFNRDAATGFSCDSAYVDRQSSFGSSYRMPARGGNEIFTQAASGAEVQAFSYSYNQQSYAAEPVQLFFDEHPKPDPTGYWSFRGRAFRRIEWDESRKTLWCVDRAGNLLGMTRSKQLQISAWHTHELGGYNSSEVGGETGSGLDMTWDPAYFTCSGSVVSLAVVPNPGLRTNDIWLAVKRKINGAWVYHIERIVGGMIPSDSVYGSTILSLGPTYTDASVQAPNTGGTTTLPCAHLEAQSVVGTAYNARGFFALSEMTVAAGNATLTTGKPPRYATETYTMILGLPFTTIIEPSRPEAGSVIGTAQGAIKRIHEVTLRFFRTMAAKVGRDPETLETLVFREAVTPLDKSPDLFSGDKRVKINCDYDRDGYLCVVADKPLPFALISITAEGVTADG